MTIAQDIRAAGESLTHQTWIRWNYFSVKKDQVCMCAHGAMLAQSNKIVKKFLLGVEIVSPIEVEAELDILSNCSGIHGAGAAGAAGSSAIFFWRKDMRISDPETSFAYAWSQRPSWVRESNVEASYLLGMVGMTPTFNDHDGTTLEMVKEKFREAAELAERLGV